MKKIYFIFLLIIIIAISYISFKQNKPIGIIVEEEDEIKITYPRDLDEVKGLVNVAGKADKNFEFVELQIDLKGWEKASGVVNWNYSFDSSNLNPGIHVIYARASDNIRYTKIKAVRIKVV